MGRTPALQLCWLRACLRQLPPGRGAWHAHPTSTLRACLWLPVQMKEIVNAGNLLPDALILRVIREHFMKASRALWLVGLVGWSVAVVVVLRASPQS